MSGKHKPKEPTKREESNIRSALNKYCFMGDLSVELGYTNNWVGQRLYYLLKLGKVKKKKGLLTIHEKDKPNILKVNREGICE
jgi:hypothetical protein